LHSLFHRPYLPLMVLTLMLLLPLRKMTHMLLFQQFKYHHNNFV